MRRPSFTFPHGAPGVGLLLIRLVVGTSLVAHGVTTLAASPPVGRALLDALSCGLGLLLLAGLWTSIAGILVFVYAVGDALAYSAARWYCVSVAILGAALALLGPGFWSLDARRHGWKRLEIPDPKKSNSPPE